MAVGTVKSQANHDDMWILMVTGCNKFEAEVVDVVPQNKIAEKVTQLGGDPTEELF